MTLTFPMLAYFGPKLLQENCVEQARVRKSPFKKRHGRKELRKKENDQRNKPHIHLVKSETTICTQHILGINALLVLLVSFIYGCLVMKSHGGCMSIWDQDCKSRLSLIRTGDGV
jgi:hypothetical protein